MAKEHYEQGKQAFNSMKGSKHYVHLDLNMPAQQAMKLFMGPVDEGDMPMQVQRPLPRPNQDWIKGFNDARKDWLSDDSA